MTLYDYARVSVREPEDKNLDLQVEPPWGAGGVPGGGYSRRLSSCMKMICSRPAASRAVLEIDSPMTAG